MKTMKLIWEYSKLTGIRKYQSIMVLVQLLSVMIGIYYALVLKQFINNWGDPTIFILAIGIGILFVLTSSVATYIVDIVKKLVQMRLLSSMYEKLVSAPLEKLRTTTPGDFIAKFLSDTEMAGNVVGALWPAIIINLLRFIGYLLALYVLNIYLPFLILLFVPLFILIYLKQSNILIKASFQERNAFSSIVESVRAKVEAIPTIKSMGLEKKSALTLKKETEEWFSRSKKVVGILRSYVFLYSVLSMVIPLIVLFMLSKITAIDAAAIIVYFYFSGNVMEPLATLATDIGAIPQMIPSLERVRSIIDIPNEKGGNKKLRRINTMHFSGEYLGMKYNLHINRGEKIGIVGPTGSGKTTLARLLNRLYLPDKGSYEINGISAEKYDLKSLRGRIVLVTGEEPIFGGTYGENIMGKTIPEILDMSLDEKIGPGAERKLSLGERQRVSIIRALNKKPDVLILDEAMSGVHPELETQIINIIKERVPTFIVISHRFSTIQQMERVIVLSRGRIVCDFKWPNVCKKFQEIMQKITATPVDTIADAKSEQPT